MNEFNQNPENGYSQQYHPIGIPMNVEEINLLTNTLLTDIHWLFDLIDRRIQELDAEDPVTFSGMQPPDLNDSSPYGKFLQEFDVSVSERVLLMLCIVSHIAPERLTSKLVDKQHKIMSINHKFGGYVDRTSFHFIPTLQTALFLLAGDDLSGSVYHKMMICNSGKLVQEGIIRFSVLNTDTIQTNELRHVPILTAEYLHYFQSGNKPRPDYGKTFPATWVTTGLDWKHLVLEDRTFKSIREIMRWVEHGDALIESSSMFNVSYPCLFYGPPGTGKSLTAKLIGKKYGKDVFRVDLSMIVSKYIGETEKNLAYLFDRAEGKDWILFFDEADSLFSKRTSVNSSQDKWANLEVSYLLQRMEEHKGLTILATNLKNNLDNAMTRRFQSIIYFPTPKEDERKELWRNLLPQPFTYSNLISIEKLSKLEFSGANIANILKDSCLSALEHQTKEIHYEWLQESIRKEFIKENRTP